MSATRSAADRGLRAVARVRGVREQDSRLGLQLALAEQHALDGRVATLHEQLATVPGSLPATPAEILVLRSGLAALGAHLREARGEAASHHTVVDGARARWQADKSRLAAVEHLLEQRAQRRRAERAKAEAKELDDLASVRWARDTEGAHR